MDRGGTQSTYEKIKRVHVPTFDGTADSDLTEKWLNGMKNNFILLQMSEEMTH